MQECGQAVHNIMEKNKEKKKKGTAVPFFTLIESVDIDLPGALGGRF